MSCVWDLFDDSPGVHVLLMQAGRELVLCNERKGKEMKGKEINK